MSCYRHYNSNKNCGYDFGAKIFGSTDTSNIKLDSSKPETLNWTEISVPEVLCVPNKKPNIEHIDQVYANAIVSSVKLIETPYYFNSVTTPYSLAALNTAGQPYTLANGNYAVSETNVLFYTDPLTPLPNQEGTNLTGRKLVVEGELVQNVVYTADVDDQSVHSINYNLPFSAFIIPYTKVENSSQIYWVVNPSTPTAVTTIGPVYKAEDLVIDLCEDFCVDPYIEDVYITPLDCRTIFKNVTLFLKAKPTYTC